MIWSLRLYDEQTLLSGDSSGDLSVWDSNHGTLLKQFNNLKADINSIEVNERYSIVYATGVDARILSIQLNKKTGQWVYLSLFRG
jgi:WD40 repeat protein